MPIAKYCRLQARPRSVPAAQFEAVRGAGVMRSDERAAGPRVCVVGQNPDRSGAVGQVLGWGIRGLDEVRDGRGDGRSRPFEAMNHPRPGYLARHTFGLAKKNPPEGGDRWDA